MKKLIKAITSKFSSEPRQDPERYEAEKKIARSSDVKARMALAGSSKTHQEILYYLAEHDDDDGLLDFHGSCVFVVTGRGVCVCRTARLLT